ncbi:MAG: DUF2520 domain-containing protein [Anaerolineae bacterium]|jgi:predicted short-subunit dehydrogenase-like oxidoreductase (DUF2520 family)|nr:DUF2520 domain-containing protein [Anaerolineae bacterium]
MTAPTLGLIGVGKVGTTLAICLADFPLTHVYNRTPNTAEKLARELGAIRVSSALEVVEHCDLTLMAVADDAIGEIVQSLREAQLTGKAVIHTSGAHSLGVLAPLMTQGAMIGSLHPVLPFASVENALKLIRSTQITMALEASDRQLQIWLDRIVSALNARAIALPSGSKALYHAALVMASNYTVTLYAVAENLLMELGASREVADQALNTLMTATVDNLKTKGVPQALTGPLVRSDVETIRAHLAALGSTDLGQLYRDLARLTYPLLLARGVSIDTLDLIIRNEKI